MLVNIFDIYHHTVSRCSEKIVETKPHTRN